MSRLKLERKRVRSCPLSTQPKYATQGAVHRRTESAILQGTKELIAKFGLSNISMIEIADHSQVSRATLYNHFKDKSAVLDSLLKSEVDRLIEIITEAKTPADALELLSKEISSDSALNAMRVHDGAMLNSLMVHAEHPLYLQLARAVHERTNSEAGTGLVMHWLLGQVAQPISEKASHEQAELLVDRTLL